MDRYNEVKYAPAQHQEFWQTKIKIVSNSFAQVIPNNQITQALKAV